MKQILGLIYLAISNNIKLLTKKISFFEHVNKKQTFFKLSSDKLKS